MVINRDEVGEPRQIEVRVRDALLELTRDRELREMGLRDPVDQHDLYRELAERVADAHKLVEERKASMLEAARYAGRILLECKRHVEHGEWETWLIAYGAHIASVRTLRLYMRIASKWDELQNGNDVAVLSIRDAQKVLAERGGGAPAAKSEIEDASSISEPDNCHHCGLPMPDDETPSAAPDTRANSKSYQRLCEVFGLLKGFAHGADALYEALPLVQPEEAEQWIEDLDKAREEIGHLIFALASETGLEIGRRNGKLTVRRLAS